MQTNLLSKFTRRDQIQWLESEIRRLVPQRTPVKLKKEAMLNDLISLVRAQAEPTLPTIIYCARIVEQAEQEKDLHGWLVAVTPEKFEEAVFHLLRKGNGKRYYRLENEEAIQFKPKLELFHLNPRILAGGWARINQENIDAYVYQKL